MATQDIQLERVKMPHCPYCREEMVRAHEQNEEGEWCIRWLCGCKPDLEVVHHIKAEIARAQDGE